MLKLDGKEFSRKFTYAVWLIMSFKAGYVNVGAFFLAGFFVSHVTGTSSRIGMGVASIDLIDILMFSTVLLSFIGGAAFSGYFIGRPMEEGKKPQYVFVLSVKAIFFGLAFVLSGMALTELWGIDTHHRNLIIIFFLSFCCGVQNSTCSLSTNGFLKPTHMTGLSTDIGIFLTKVYAWDKKSSRFKIELHKNMLRIRILASFIFGGIVSAFIFRVNGHYGLLFPFISSFCFLCLAIVRDFKIENRGRGLLIQTAKGSVFATFLSTLFVGLSSAL